MSEIGTPSPEEIGVPRTLEQGHDETLATYDEAVNTLLQMEPYRRSAAKAIFNGSRNAPFYLPGEGWFNVYRDEFDAPSNSKKTLVIEEGKLTDQGDKLPEDVVNPYDFFPTKGRLTIAIEEDSYEDNPVRRGIELKFENRTVRLNDPNRISPEPKKNADELLGRFRKFTTPQIQISPAPATNK